MASAVQRLDAEELHRAAPYEALAKFIEPRNNEFPEEKAAMELRAKLHRELPSWNLGKIRRAEFYPLPDGRVRYEVATGVSLTYRAEAQGRTTHICPLRRRL